MEIITRETIFEGDNLRFVKRHFKRGKGEGIWETLEKEKRLQRRGGNDYCLNQRKGIGVLLWNLSLPNFWLALATEKDRIVKKLPEGSLQRKVVKAPPMNPSSSSQAKMSTFSI